MDTFRVAKRDELVFTRRCGSAKDRVMSSELLLAGSAGDVQGTAHQYSRPSEPPQ
jgi:hypothetical protein